ncbi:MAG: indole-3-glycerol-phosphate synthase TrpC, partial [candidate division Zixibacteria bacterium]|nr:indole-3-glycerol-phosphate synthase TrpC [candidate division Zixibacteria bacterium]
IVRLHSRESLVEMITLAETLGLDCLIEVHDEKEAEVALETGARILGVNNRNLADFTVDLATSERLASLIPDDVIAVSESGILEPTDIARLKQAGYTRFLIGEALVKASDPILLLKTLRSA